MLILGQEVILEIDKKKIRTTLRGWKEGKGAYLILDQPPAKEMWAHLKPGTETIIRYEQSGTVFGLMGAFTASIGVINLWVFHLKGDAVDRSLRKDERFRCMLPVLMIAGEEGQGLEKVEGMIDDLSFTGARILTKKRLLKTEPVFIYFFLSDAGPVKLQRLKIIRSQRGDDLYEYAGSFTAMNHINRNAIMTFLKICREWQV